MKQLKVPFSQTLHQGSPIEEISASLDQLEPTSISMAPWSAFSYKPKAGFAFAHSNDCLFVKFYVSEKAIQAIFREPNDPVYKDSCVELFIAFNGDKEYYNLEFNCLGTCRAGFGSERLNREPLPEKVIANIRSLSVIEFTDHTDPDTCWELTLKIPIEVFYLHDLPQLEGIKSKVNFFKCGDELPEPHYLSWSNIKTDEPNFHLSEFFGELQFL